jgi:plasmid stabilization system protein ParE
MSYVFHPDAEVELNQAIEWYEAREPGLGLDFAAQVYAAIQRAQAFPLAWQEMGSDIRRALVHRFPYGVLYVPERDRVLVIAVMHLHRQPDYWQDRKA